MSNWLKMAQVNTIRTLLERGWSQRRIARELGIDRETVARYSKASESKPAISTAGDSSAIPGDLTEQAQPWSEARPAIPTAGSVGRKSWCSGVEKEIAAKLELGLSAQRIHQDIRSELGFLGSYESVKRFVRRLGASTPLPFRRMECAPGEEAQVDFGQGARTTRPGCKRKTRPHLFRTHVRRIDHVTAKVLAAVGDVAVRDLRLDAVLVFRQRRVKQGAAARTANLEVGGFRSMIRWAFGVGLIPRDPLASLRPLPAGKAHETMPRRAFTAEEIERFIEASLAMDGDGERHLDARPGQRLRFHGAARRPRVPQTALWRAFLYTGGRWNELVSTTWSDFDECARTLTFRAKTTKGKRQRVIPLVDVVVADLVALRDIHRRLRGRDPEPGEALFLAPAGKPIRGNETRARWRFRQVLKRAGIERVDAHGRRATIHGLRHSFCSMLARAGVGLSQAQKLMGHSDP